MKKTILILGVAMLAATTTVKAQTHWSILINEIAETENGNLGTSNNRSLNFYTNEMKRATLDSTGSFKLNNLAGTGDRILVVDENGNLKPIGYAPGSPCIIGTPPWSMGGNIVGSGDNTAGTCSNHDFVLKANATPLIFMKTNKTVGIGPNNNNPGAQLDISDGSSEHMLFSGDNNGKISNTTDMNLEVGSTGNFYISSASNNIPNLNIMGGKTGIGMGFSQAPTKLSVESGSSDGIQSRTSSSTAKALAVYNTGSSNTNFAVLGSGQTNVGYQTNQQNAAMLNINVSTSQYGSVNALDVYDQVSQKINFRVNSYGNVFCRELHVLLSSATVPDFVFDKGYKLLSIKDRQKYINENGHLPHMLSAKEVEAEGAPVGKLMLGVLQNTEELTLYLFELNEKIDKLAKENQNLKEELKSIKKPN